MKLLNVCIMNSCNRGCYYCPMKPYLRPLTREQTLEDKVKGWAPVNRLTAGALIKYYDKYIDPDEWYFEYTGGEPGLFPEWGELIPAHEKRGDRVIIKTNGDFDIPKGKNIRLIASWHEGADFPKHYDQIVILKNPKDDWKSKAEHCKRNGIPFQLSVFDSSYGRNTPDPAYLRFNKTTHIMHINSFGQIVPCPKVTPELGLTGHPEKWYDVFNLCEPVMKELAGDCAKCKLANDAEVFLPEGIMEGV